MFKKTLQKTISYLNFNFKIKLSKHVIKVPIRGGIGTIHRHYYKNWKTIIIEKLLNLKQGDFLDIGANVGQTLLDFLDSDINTKYLGFEPNLSCANYVKELIEVNGLLNCNIFPLGLSKESSLAEFYQTDKTNPNSTLIKDLRPGKEHRISQVFVTKLDEIYQAKPSLIKIDVEGSEFEVLLGSSKIIDEYHPIILCEILFRDPVFSMAIDQNRKKRLMQFLQEKNYLIYQIIKTEDLREVKHLVKIDSLSDDAYCIDNQNLCDYLLFNSEDEQKVLESFKFQ